MYPAGELAVLRQLLLYFAIKCMLCIHIEIKLRQQDGASSHH